MMYLCVIRYSYLLELSMMSGSALLLVGPTGTGKSLCVREKMNLFNGDQLASLCLTFTAQTSSAQVQVTSESFHPSSGACRRHLHSFLKKQFQSSFRAVSEQFQSNLRAIWEQ